MISLWIVRNGVRDSYQYVSTSRTRLIDGTWHHVAATLSGNVAALYIDGAAMSGSWERAATPLSYHGLLIRLTWCVRLRLYLTGGREIVTEQPFYLVASKRHAPYAASTHWVDGESKDEVHGEVGSPLLARSPQQLSAHGSASQ